MNNENGNEYMFMGIEMNIFMEVLLLWGVGFNKYMYLKFLVYGVFIGL